MRQPGAPVRRYRCASAAEGPHVGRRPADMAGVDAIDVEVIGTARVDRRTKALVPRLIPGEIAFIDHEDIDRVAAEGLVESGVVAVVNAAASISGRYPNVGPMIIVAAGIVLLDRVGQGGASAVIDGQHVCITGNNVMVNGAVVLHGARQTLQSLDAELVAAKENIGVVLAQFAENTLEYVRAEQFLLLESPNVPDLAIDLTGRHVLIVVRGDQFREDLAALSGYISDLKPVLIGVDGGADALLNNGLKPHIIVGDFDSVSSKALHCGAQLIVHAYPDGGAPGAQRLTEEGVAFTTMALAGTSEDVAMLMAHEKGAELIVAVGTHVNLVDFLDKGRSGMASTFLTRLKVGPILIDAKGVNKLYQPRLERRWIVIMVLAALSVLMILMAVTPVYRVFWRSLWLMVRG